MQKKLVRHLQTTVEMTIQNGNPTWSLFAGLKTPVLEKWFLERVFVRVYGRKDGKYVRTASNVYGICLVCLFLFCLVLWTVPHPLHALNRQLRVRSHLF